MKKSVKILSIVMAVVLVFACGIGATLAYLSDKTGEIKNTFTYGNIDITLTELGNQQYHIVPGSSETKDPIVTVEANSEACYLFVEITAKDMDLVRYELNTEGFTKGTGVDGNGVPENVYFREVEKSTENTVFHMIKDGKVSYDELMSKETIDEAIASGKTPSLTFQAYAVQKDHVTTAKEAWELANEK